jgi:hypothetical protein
MVPLGLFRIRNFAGANLATAFVYGAVTMGLFAIALYTQEVAGYSATVAGLATLPTPVISFLFARRVGAMAARIGPRIFVMTGPVVAGFGLLLIRPSGHGFNVVTHLLPGMIVLATGLVLTITPLTTVNLSAVEPVHSGIAAAIQNATGRTSALIAVACVGPIAAGALNDASFTRLLQVSAVLFLIGAVISGVTITNPTVALSPLPVKSPPCAATGSPPNPILPAGHENHLRNVAFIEVVNRRDKWSGRTLGSGRSKPDWPPRIHPSVHVGVPHVDLEWP